MSQAARAVLHDCRLAHEWLEDESDADRFRLMCVAAMALLRAVGHVLKNVDASRDEVLQSILSKRYEEWKQGRDANGIFRFFIEAERNGILKQYLLPYQEGAIPAAVVTRTEHISFNDIGFGLNLLRPLTDGPYAGEDIRDVIRQAIAWWQTRLDELDKERGESTARRVDA